MDSERGTVIIIVVWALAIIGVIATFILYQTQAEWASTISFEQRIKFREAANTALQERLALLTSDDTEYDCAKDPWYGDTGEISFQKNGYQIIIKIEDEGSKPNLNLIAKNPRAIQYLLNPINKNNGPSSEPINDWWDTDDEGGVENSYYQSLNPGYKSRNGFFSSLEELKMLKNGDKLYQLLANDVTIYGKINPNIISGEIFANLLNSAGGFEKSWIETVRSDFEQYRPGSRFNQIDDFLKLSHITLLSLERLKPLFRFDGICNINLVTKEQLNTILKFATPVEDNSLVDRIINRRKENPFKSSPELMELSQSIQPQDRFFDCNSYFTVVSTIIRYRIWVIKDEQKYYVDTVQEREIKGLRKEWVVHPLYWRELINKEVPEPPEIEEDETDEKAIGDK